VSLNVNDPPDAPGHRRLRHGRVRDVLRELLQPRKVGSARRRFQSDRREIDAFAVPSGELGLSSETGSLRRQ
jgi:hypothetical protein